ncbi:cytochrome b/b6 domain-containing protein [Thalassotalea aquiviva]|uniref:cytochrome b/b6 domain-containing protein n=1 Tax=Thalassotalea aquiviva TaxID=3242415 RepID=UPI00352AF1D9
MNTKTARQPKYGLFKVWDKGVRLFHWLNVICILGLMAVGLFILNSKSFGVSGEGKILLKTIHVYIGYVFVVNLIGRMIWGFIGNKYARWNRVSPFYKGFFGELKSYLAAIRQQPTSPYVGHNPLAKLMISVLFTLMIVQGSTGLILAGTDLYFPPFGHKIAEYVGKSDNESSNIVKLTPGSKEGVDAKAYAQMRAYRKPIINLHVLTFYLLLFFIGLHLVGVVFTEIKEKNGLVSAMITGKKYIKDKPIDP